MSFRVQEVLEWRAAMHAEAVALLRLSGHELDAAEPRLRLASASEQEHHCAAAVLEFDVTGETEFVQKNHAAMGELLRKLAQHMRSVDSRIVGANVLQTSRHVARPATDEDPGPVCDEASECGCCGGPYVDNERYCRFMLYVRDESKKRKK